MSEHSVAGREDNRYPQIVRAVVETPWAILPSKLRAIKEVLAIRIAGDRLTDEEIQARIGAAPNSSGFYQAGPVAVVPLSGTIFPKANVFTQISGGTSVEDFRATLFGALADEQTKAVVIDVDSPGGMTDLLPEIAAEIRNARGDKPIVAVANTLMASAAYWIGSQADEVVVTPSGEVGSIGVFAAHDDFSKQLEMEGITTTLISAGKYKTEGNPFEPLTEEAKQAIQDTVDEFYGMFVSDVAKGRDVSVDTVKSGFGEGRVVTASAAVPEGMADRVATLEQTIGRLANANGRSRVSRGTALASDTVGAAAHNISATFTGNAPPEPDPDTDLEAAESGLSFADATDEALRALNAVVTGSEALRVLTGKKREQLATLIERGQTLLAQTEPPLALGEGLEHEWALAELDSRLRL